MSDNVFEFKKKETPSTEENTSTPPPGWKTKISQFYGIYKPSQILSLLKHPRFNSLEVTKGLLKGTFLTGKMSSPHEVSKSPIPNTGEGAVYEQLFSMEEFVIEFLYIFNEEWFRAHETFSFLDSPKEGLGFRSEGVKIWKTPEILSGKDEELVHEHIWQSTGVESLTELDLTDSKNHHPLAVYYHQRADFRDHSSLFFSCLMKDKVLVMTLPDKSFSIFVF